MSILSQLKNAALGKTLSFPPGHSHSPICNPAELRPRYRDPLTSIGSVDLPGIDLNIRGQTERLMRWGPTVRNIQRFPKIPQPDLRYYSGNSQYARGDAISLYCFMRELRPRKIIEIGSGFSSACMLDSANSLDLEIAFTFIDPSSDRLNALLKPGDHQRAAILRVPVQDVPLATFHALESGDILFIDSTHVLKTCSDVEFELFCILPRLKPGVFIHFHDIFYPFEYPPQWVLVWNYSWNEAYALRALLMYQNRFRIEFWSHYLAIAHKDDDVVQQCAPVFEDASNFWVRKV